ncbi:MAG: LacI family DNA-binding transcriptional regulator [Janthinobacterium lividum]
MTSPPGVPPRPATIVDVARAAGVSRQTVTRALHDMTGINPATRERVLSAARDLHYHPSRFGRGLVKPSTRTLGLLVGDLANPYYAELASTVLGLAGEQGWNVVMAEPANSDDLVAGVDAVVSFTGLQFTVAAAGAPNLPVVEIDPPAVHPDRGRVVLDRGPATEAAVHHLVQRGTRRPVVLDTAEPVGSSSRAAAFVDAFRRAGVEPRTAPSRTPWRELAPGRPDAVLAYNDLEGFGVLRDLRAAGVGVPEEVRVMGVDGLAVGAYVTPRLSTLATDLSEVAGAALGLVLGLAEGRVRAADAVATIVQRFVAGDST